MSGFVQYNYHVLYIILRIMSVRVKSVYNILKVQYFVVLCIISL